MSVSRARAILKPVRLASWTHYGAGPPTRPSSAALDGVPVDAPVLTICRSGVRSQVPRRRSWAGYLQTFNVTEGFEGDLDAEGHRTTGWKHAGLPWRQG